MAKTILITGASSGFGLMLANSLHQKGFNVIGTSREPNKYQDKVDFKLLRLDIADEASIIAFTKQLFETVNQLDVLVNSAGYMLTGIAEETSSDIGKKQFETNFWGTINLTNSILPYFRKQRSGQIITVSSIMGLIGLPNKSVYTASKHALEGYFKSLRFELSQFNIKVNMVQPMWAKTNLGANTISVSGDIPDYQQYKKQVNAYIKKSIAEGEDPEIVVKVIEKLIDTKSSKFRNPVGKMSKMILFLNNYAYSMFEGAIHNSVKTAK